MESPREINIMDYPRVIWKRAWLIALVTFLVTAATFTVSVLLKDVYEAEITFRIMGQQTKGTAAISQIPSSAQTALGLYAGDQELQTYAQILTSRHIIGKVIDALPHLMDKYHTGQRKGLSLSTFSGAACVLCFMRDMDARPTPVLSFIHL